MLKKPGMDHRERRQEHFSLPQILEEKLLGFMEGVVLLENQLEFIYNNGVMTYPNKD
jgi:hypothetical protein